MIFKNHVNRLINSAARRRGYEITPIWRLEAQPLARHLKSIFNRYEIDCVMDVGGNKGQYHDFLRDEVGFEGLIITFEPVAQYVQLLRERAKSDLNWRIFAHALGAIETTMEINVTSSPGLNSFLEPSTTHVEGFWDQVSIKKETVQIKPLDLIFKELQTEFKFSKIYLKLDTQGFDLEVIKGGTQSLSEITALQSEASVKPIYQGMPNFNTTIKTCEDFGFELSGTFPVSLDDELRLIEFDCVMVRVTPRPSGQ